MNWLPLQSSDQIDLIIERSHQIPVVIFKHSTRCSISSMAKYRLESDWQFSNQEIEAYFLDVISQRNTSKDIAEKFSVWHESPQLLLIKNGACTYDASHLDITVEELKECLPASRHD